MIYFVPHICVGFNRHEKKVQLAIDPTPCKLQKKKKKTTIERALSTMGKWFCIVDLFLKNKAGSF